MYICVYDDFMEIFPCRRTAWSERCHEWRESGVRFSDIREQPSVSDPKSVTAVLGQATLDATLERVEGG